MTYSGSNYPIVPAGSVVICVLASPKALVRPRSATLAPRSAVSRMLLLFTSLWINAGLHATCRYSRPVFKVNTGVRYTCARANLRNW